MIHWKQHALNAAEAFRCAAEYAQFKAGWPELRKQSPKGDGHPVLVLPPFTGNDTITAPLRNTLTEVGYKTYGWEAGSNLGLNDKKAQLLHDRLKEIYEENGRQKVSLVGLSLGGIIARELAREYPEMVREAISVNTPFGIGTDKDAVPPLLAATIQILSDEKFSLKSEGMTGRLVTPPPVPTTSIFSKTDGIAGWRACLNPKSPLAENIEISGSHVGGFWNLEAVSVILNRLAQPEGEWKPLKQPRDYCENPDPSWKKSPAGKQHFFPKN